MRGVRYPAMLLCLLLLAGCQTEGEFRLHWKLWGFESRTFTVGDERVRVRVDTSGYGLYEVEAEEGAITVLRDGVTAFRSRVDATTPEEIVAQMMAELTKGGDRPLTEITPEQMTDAILHTVDTSVLDPDKLTVFRSGVVSLFENLPRAAHEQ